MRAVAILSGVYLLSAPCLVAGWWWPRLPDGGLAPAATVDRGQAGQQEGDESGAGKSPRRKPGKSRAPGKRARQTDRKRSQLQKKWRYWNSVVTRLVGWLKAGSALRRAQALQELRAIRDPAALVPLVAALETNSADCRALLLEGIAPIADPKAHRLLAAAAVADPSPKVRTAAIALMARHPEGKPTYQKVLDDALRSELTGYVYPAAAACRQLHAVELVPTLIDVLVSAVPTGWEMRQQYFYRLFSRGGSWKDVIGNLKVVKTVKPHPPVLQALRAITGKDFGYNRDSWRNWWSRSGRQLLNDSKAGRAAGKAEQLPRDR